MSSQTPRWKDWLHALATLARDLFGPEPPQQSNSPSPPKLIEPPSSGTITVEGYGGPFREGWLDQALAAIVRSDYWGYDTFRKVMTALAERRGGPYLPAPLCPLSIDLDGWAREARRLIALTAADRRERGAAVLVDLNRGEFVLGQVHTGTVRNVQIDGTLQPGREHSQRIVAGIHTHPTQTGSQGMSPEDYEALLCEPQMRAALLAWDNRRLLVLKTSATPYGRACAGRFKAHIKASRAEWLEAGGLPDRQVARFNKAMCTEFGLVMYLGREPESVVRRVKVTE